MSHVIQTCHIAAALHTCAVLDIRYYLNGIYIDSRITVSTDGHCASAYLGEECDQYLPPFIIPSDAAKLIAKIKSPRVTAVAVPDGRIDIGGIVFKPVEGKYPDYRRVFAGKADMTSPHKQQFAPELAFKFQKVAASLKIKGAGKFPCLYPVADGMGFRVAIQGAESEFMGVLMPFENKGPMLCGDWL